MPISVNDPAVYNNNVGLATNGQLLLADVNTIIAQVNTDSSTITSIATGSYTFTGLKTFSNGIATNTIAPVTSGVGVAIIPSLATASNPTTPTNGMVWYNSSTNQLLAQVNGATATVSTGAPTYGRAFQATAAPVYATGTALTVASIACRDSTNASDIAKTSSTTCNIGTSGINGLDTGTVASNTWYYLYVIAQVSGGNPALLLSVTNETVSGTVAMPASYSLKRQLPFAVRTDGSAAFREWRIVNWGSNPTILYSDITNSRYNGAYVTGTNNVLAVGTASSFTAVSCTSWVPPISTMAMLSVSVAGSSNTYGRARATGRSDTGHGLSAGNPIPLKIWQPLNTSQSFDYIVDAAGSGFNIDVEGYTITTGVF